MVNSERLDAVFSALADPTRRRIVEQLARRPMTAGEIAAQFSISQPGVSKHLRVLEESGLLKREVQGRFHRCTLASEPMAAASEWIDKHTAFWSATLERLDSHVKASSKRKKRT